MKRALLASLAAFGILAAPTIATATTTTQANAKVAKSQKKAAKLAAARRHKAAVKTAAKSN